MNSCPFRCSHDHYIISIEFLRDRHWSATRHWSLVYCSVMSRVYSPTHSLMYSNQCWVMPLAFQRPFAYMCYRSGATQLLFKVTTLTRKNDLQSWTRSMQTHISSVSYPRQISDEEHGGNHDVEGDRDLRSESEPLSLVFNQNKDYIRAVGRQTST